VSVIFNDGIYAVEKQEILYIACFGVAWLMIIGR